MAPQCREHIGDGGIQEVDALVATGGREVTAIGAESESMNNRRGKAHVEEGTAGRNLPDHDPPLASGRGQAQAVPAKDDASEKGDCRVDQIHRLPGLQFDQPQRIICEWNQVLPVWAERHAFEGRRSLSLWRIRYLPAKQLLAGSGVPDLGSRSVASAFAACDPGAVGTKGQALRWPAHRSSDRYQLPAGCRIPDPQAAVIAARGQPPAVRAEDHPVDLSAVTGEFAYEPARSDLPEPRHQLVPADGREQTPVGAVSDVFRHHSALFVQGQQAGVMQPVEEM